MTSANIPLSGSTPGPREHKVKFDPTISLGHVLTFVSLVLAGFGVYNGMDKRITVLEEQRRTDSERSTEIDKRLKETLSEMRIDVKELQRSLNDIGRNVIASRK